MKETNRNEIQFRKIDLEDVVELNTFLNNLSREVKSLIFEEYEVFTKRSVEHDLQFINAQNSSGVMLGAFSNGKIIAFGTLTYFKDHIMLKKTCEIGITVDEEFQNKGVGSKLLAKLIEHAKKDGKNRINLNVLEVNKRAINFYQKNNFEIISINEGIYNDIKVIFMSLYI